MKNHFFGSRWCCVFSWCHWIWAILFLAALGSPLRSALRCSVPHQILFPTLNPSLVGFVFPKTRLLCHQLVSSSRFVAACGPLRSDLGIRYVSFAEYAIRSVLGVFPAWAGLSFPIFRSSALLAVPILDSSPVCFSVRNPTAVVLCWIFPRSACWISFLRPLL
jgi:hypothetical protein